MIQLTLIPTKFQDVIIKISEEDHNMWISIKKSKLIFIPLDSFIYIHSMKIETLNLWKQPFGVKSIFK